MAYSGSRNGATTARTASADTDAERGVSAVPLLRMRGISKAFPGVQALRDVDLTVRRGEVHALVGENGAGKSTLMKILAGACELDEGDIELASEPIEIRSPKDARDRGIAMVHQEFTLVPELSVAENILLGRLPRGRFGGVSWREARAAVAGLLDQIDVQLDPAALVKDLPVGSQQLVEIAKAFGRAPSLIVLDEPTSALTEREVQALFRTIGELKRQGISIIYISHRVGEVTAIADRVTVLRDGALVETRSISDAPPEAIVRLMVGRALDDLFPKQDAEIGGEVLTVRGLGRIGVFHDIDLTLRRGEIVGLAGLMGAGRSEIARALFGLEPADFGEILVDGRRTRIRSPSDAIRAGIAFVPEDRKRTGLLLNRSVRENLTLTVLRELTVGGVVRKRTERPLVKRLLGRSTVRPAQLEREVVFLSGGNQQKVVVAKWLAREPKVLILDEPTRGIDLAAKAEIHALVGELAAAGVAILLISSELVEVLSASDRVLVIREGRLAAAFSAAEASEEAVMIAATGNAA